MNLDTDVAIVGAGPGGTCCSLALAERGIRSVLIEKDRFPRYHIGESMTGECGAALRSFGLEPELERLRYPIKLGVRVFSPKGDHSFWVPVMRRDPEAGLCESTTWQVRRAEFDALMLETARERGAELLSGEAVTPLRDGNAVSGIRVRTTDGAVDVRARTVVDASGPACFLSRAGVASRKERGQYDNQVAIFSQVRGAIRDPGPDGGNTLIFYAQPNHWAWFIPLDDEIVSIGVVVPTKYFKEQGLSREAFFRREILETNPNLTERVGDIELVEEVRAASNYSYEIESYTGPGYLCIGDAHRFIDPVFSFGLHFAVKEGQLAAEAIAHHLADEGDASEVDGNPYRAFEEMTTRGMDRIQDLIDCFWERPSQFALIVHQKYREDCIDLFAGRLYDELDSAGMIAVRKVLAKSRGLEMP